MEPGLSSCQGTRPPDPLKCDIVANVMHDKPSICALVAASDFNPEHFKIHDARGEFDYVVAVDGGYAHLQAVGRVPDMAIGDFDSLGYVPECKVVSQHPTHKNESDLELALDSALELGFTDLVVYGALGGRLDHTVANLQLMALFGERGVRVTAIGDDCSVRVVVGPDVYQLPLRDSGTVSVFSVTDEAFGVVEQGMEYSFDDEVLTNRTSRGLSNELKGEPASVAVEKGTLLVFRPL